MLPVQRLWGGKRSRNSRHMDDTTMAHAVSSTCGFHVSVCGARCGINRLVYMTSPAYIHIHTYIYATTARMHISSWSLGGSGRAKRGWRICVSALVSEQMTSLTLEGGSEGIQTRNVVTHCGAETRVDGARYSVTPSRTYTHTMRARG